MRQRSRLNARERGYLFDLTTSVLDLRLDYPRRLRNALLVLAQADPGWMVWVEQNLPRHLLSRWQRSPARSRRYLALVESRARALILKQYSFFRRDHIGALIFRPDWACTDDGSLPLG